MRNRLLYTCLAILALTSCAKTDTPSAKRPGETMHFMAGVTDKTDDWGPQQNATRGVPADNTTIRQFGAYCFNTGRTQWASAAAAALPNKMYDVPVTRNGNEWTYDPPVKWEGGDGAYFTFFGYSPRAAGIYQEPDSPLGNNLELLTSATDPGVPKLRYSTLDYVPSQVDLLFAAPVYNTYPVDKVKMQFFHALAQIRFKAWSEQDFVRVKSISIYGVQYAGTFSLDGTLTPESDVKSFSLTEINKTLSTDETKMTDLTDGGNAFMLLPQDLTANTTAQIVVTYLVSGEEKTSTPYTIVQNWQKGNSYTYTLKLGGTATEEMIVTGVTVTDWVIDGEEDMTTMPPMTPRVGDYYYSDDTFSTALTAGKTATGLIFWVDPDEPLVYNVMAFEESPSNLAWAATSFYIISGARNNVSGYINTMLMKMAFDNGNADGEGIMESTFDEAFPAAGYCYNYKGKAGTDPIGTWYLPAKNELQYLWCAYNGMAPTTWDATAPTENTTAQASWNDRIKAGGAINGISSGKFMASTEVEYEWSFGALYTDFPSGTTSNLDKETSASVRCVRSFPVLTPPAVGDYYYSDGTYSTTLKSQKTATGIIYWVAPDNIWNIKVMALEESPSPLAWAANSLYWISMATDDGLAGKANTKRLKEAFDMGGVDSKPITEPTFDEAFPAAAYCYNYKGKAGTDPIGTWYLPAKTELQYLWCVYNGVAPTIWNDLASVPTDATAQASWNAKIQAGGVAKNMTNDFFWSSTCSQTGNGSIGVNFSDTKSGNYDMTTRYSVRCVRDR